MSRDEKDFDKTTKLLVELLERAETAEAALAEKQAQLGHMLRRATAEKAQMQAEMQAEMQALRAQMQAQQAQMQAEMQALAEKREKQVVEALEFAETKKAELAQMKAELAQMKADK